MLSYNLENRGRATLTSTLYRCIRTDIDEGRLAAGEKLPSKRSLAQQLKISVITVENAYAQLVAEGYLRARAKCGFFVQQAENLPTPPAPLPPQLEEEPAGSYRLDLKAQRVDAARFPFATWSRLMRQVLSEQDERLLEPVPNQGVWALRAAIAAELRSFRGLSASPEQIVVGAGTEYLYQLLVQLLGRERPIAVEDPGYPKLRRIYEKSGALCLPTPLDESGLSVQALAASGAEVAHVSPSHHYPTGIVMPVARRLALLRWAGREKYLIEDDYDSELRFSGHPIRPLFDLDENGRVIYMNTFSQSIAPSIRISYMVLPPALLAQYRRELSFYSSTVPAFEQYTLAKFIADGYFEKHLNRMRNAYRARREQMVEALQESVFSAQSAAIGSHAGLHFLLRLHSCETDEALRSRAAREGLRLSFLAEYAAVPDARFAHTLVVNDSGSADLREAIALLSRLQCGEMGALPAEK